MEGFRRKFNFKVRNNIYTPGSPDIPSRRELFNPFVGNRVIEAAERSKLPQHEKTQYIRNLVELMERYSFLPVKETKNIGSINGVDSEGHIIPLPLPLKYILKELNSKYELTLEEVGQARVEQFARETNIDAMEVLKMVPFGPRAAGQLAAQHADTALTLPSDILNDESRMVPVINFLTASGLRYLSGMELQDDWTDPYSQEG